MEEWRLLTRLPGYEVSNTGKVRSLKSGQPKLMSIVENNRGYMLCCLINNKKRITGYVHRLVAEAFLPTDRNLHELEVNHKDKNPKNNNVKNLEWVSYIENAFHKVDPHRYFLVERLKNAIDVLSNDQLEEIIVHIEKSSKLPV
jgi:hypothetical protein